MAATEPSAPVVPGYAVARLLGKGAGSEVWAAVEETTGEPVAVKIADPTAYPPGQLRSSAAREIAVLDRVSSEHVLRLRTTVTLPTGALALVLDVAEGGSLAGLVAGRGRLADGEVVTICTAVATTLAALHRCGVIHGDLTAGNVLFTGDGKPLLADFATARLVGESDPPLVAGTAGFVAPEVARGDIPTEASDAYGLGALAWFALTGQARTEQTEPALSEAVGYLGRRLGPVVAPLLAHDPASRPLLPAAASDFYRATTAVPVTLLGPGVDPAAALTRRIRAQAQEPESSPAATGSSTGQPAWRARLWARLWALRRWALVPAILLVATVVVIAAARVVGVLTTQGALPVVAAGTPSLTGSTNAPEIPGAANGLGTLTSPSRAPVSSSAESPVPGPSPGPVPAESSGPGPSPEPVRAESPGPGPSPDPVKALRADPIVVLTTLADARAAALTDADPAQLLRVAAPDSPAHRADAALLADLAGSQTRYADLAFSVRSAALQGDADESQALVRAVIDRSGYRVLGPGSAQRSVPAEAGTAYVYRLVLVEGQWRLTDIT